MIDFSKITKGLYQETFENNISAQDTVDGKNPAPTGAPENSVL